VSESEWAWREGEGEGIRREGDTQTTQERECVREKQEVLETYGNDGRSEDGNKGGKTHNDNEMYHKNQNEAMVLRGIPRNSKLLFSKGKSQCHISKRESRTLPHQSSGGTEDEK
jgi:hypothetical protein